MSELTNKLTEESGLIHISLGVDADVNGRDIFIEICSRGKSNSTKKNIETAYRQGKEIMQSVFNYLPSQSEQMIIDWIKEKYDLVDKGD